MRLRWSMWLSGGAGVSARCARECCVVLECFVECL